MSENEEKSLDPLLALSSELPELPEPVAFLHNIPRNALFSADQMRAYANGHATYWYEMHRSLLTAYNELRAANARGDGVSIADDTVEAYCAAVEAHLAGLTPKDWEIERFDPKASVRRVARIGLEAARINEVNAVLYRVQEYMHTHHDFLVSIDEYMEGSKQPTTDETCRGEADLTSTPGSEVKS